LLQEITIFRKKEPVLAQDLLFLSQRSQYRAIKI
jgi:hypothetical protein